jgi:hypothetical protein
MTLDNTDGILEFKGATRTIRVILDSESGWYSEDAPEIARTIALDVPYKALTHGLTGYDPAPVVTALNRAVELFGGEIVQLPEIPTQDGVIY